MENTPDGVAREVVAMMAIQAPASVRWPLAARDTELGAFETVWGRRSSQGMVISGPPGVGKSKLAEECLARAVRGGFKGRRATVSAAAAQIPLGAVAHLVPAGVDLSDPVKGFAQVARALTGPGGDRAQRRWAVLVDDMHLLDASSAVLLRQLMDAGLVRLIGTLRAGEPTGEAVAALCGGDAMGRIDLDTFGKEQTQTVLRAALGAPVSGRTVHRLFTASGGNALYLRELVTGALADGSLAFDGEIWELAQDRPSSTPRLAELISARLDAAAPAARPVLELLALCEPLPLADAEAAAGDPRLLPHLEAAGLIQVTTTRHRHTVTLAHPLYGETLRNGMPVLRHRALLLAQVDRTQAYGARRREDALNAAAWQLTATGTANPALLIQAAAIARYAHDYPQALALLQPLTAEQHTTATRLMLGEVLFELGDPDRAERILADADAHAATESEVLAVTRARSFNLFWSAGRTQEALAINDAARSRVTSEQGLRVLRYSEAQMRIPSGEPARGLALLADLEDEIRDAPSPEAWLSGAMMKPVGLQMVGRVEQAVTFAEHAYTSNLKVDDRSLSIHPASQLISVASALRESGRLNEARATGERAYTAFTEASVPVLLIWISLVLGEVEWVAGHPATARRWFAEAAMRARRHHNTTTLRPALSGVAACAAVLGDLGAAERALAESRAHPALAMFLTLEGSASAWLAVARGDLAQARAHLSEGADLARAAGVVIAEAWLLTDLARLGGAPQVTDRLAELARQCNGALAQGRAHLAAALTTEDPEQLADAARELASTGADLLAAEAGTAAAAAYHRTGQTRKATAAGQLAHTHLERCEGARTPLLATAQSTAQLTARERDIALMAAHGTSSQDIAEKLHLSVRTVDNHLQHVYTKLGVTTRRELAHTLDTTGTKPTA